MLSVLCFHQIAGLRISLIGDNSGRVSQFFLFYFYFFFNSLATPSFWPLRERRLAPERGPPKQLAEAVVENAAQESIY